VNLRGTVGAVGENKDLMARSEERWREQVLPSPVSLACPLYTPVIVHDDCFSPRGDPDGDGGRRSRGYECAVVVRCGVEVLCDTEVVR
jgi:hypothetical protein